MKAVNSSISVVIPSYKMDWCIARAITSCMNQTHPVEEIIVVDDGSEDKTEKVVTELSRQDNRIHYLGLPYNTGVAMAMQFGVQAAKGEWIAFLDADDELTQNSIEARLNGLNVQPEQSPGLIYGHVYLEQESPENLVRNRLLSGNCYPYLCKELSLCQQITMLVLRRAFQVSGFPSKDFPSSTDDDMLLTIAKHFPILGIDMPVAIIHTHPGSTRMTNDRFRVARGVSMLVQKYKDDILFYHGPFRLGLWWLRVARAYLKAEAIGGGVAFLEEAQKNLPFFPIGILIKIITFIFRIILKGGIKALTWYLRRYFDYLYF